jgi:hypothetical protein
MTCRKCRGWGRPAVFDLSQIDPVTDYAFEAERWAEHGILPVEGGFLSQSQWTLTAIETVRWARSEVQEELRKRRGKK